MKILTLVSLLANVACVYGYDHQAVVDTVVCEAEHKTIEQEQAVVSVIANRARASRKPFDEVVATRGQFVGYKGRQKAHRIVNQAIYDRCDGLVKLAEQGKLEDPTNGCRSFNQSHGSGMKIGKHWFY